MLYFNKQKLPEMDRREIKNMKKFLKSDKEKKNFEFFKENFYLEFPNAVNYIENQATESNFNVLAQKFSKICDNVQIEKKNNMKNIILSFENFKFIFAFLNFEGKHSEYNMNLFKIGKRYSLSVYFNNNFNNGTNNLKKSYKKIDEVEKIIAEVIRN